MKKFTFLFLTLILTFEIDVLISQNYREALYVDDFESYTAGAHIAQSIPPHWTTWNDAPGGVEDGVFQQSRLQAVHCQP